MASSVTGRTHHKFGSNERIFDPALQKIDDFLLINKPSVLCNSDGIKWIRVLGPEYYKTHGSQTCDVDKLTASFQRLTHTQQGGDCEETGLAQHEINSLDQELTSGKWMLFPESDKVDDIWSKIAKATVIGKLGNGATMAKVSTVGDNESEAYIAVYTPDYRNKSQVFDVEKKMRQIGIKGKLKYKPDINTKSGVYRNNDHKVKPSIYETYDETSSSRGGYNRGRGEYGGGRGGYRGGRGGYRGGGSEYRGGRVGYRGGRGGYHGGRGGYKGGSSGP